MSVETTTYDLPSDIVEELLCSHCGAYVSCGPIKVRPNGGTICGRCSPTINEGYTHVLFESTLSKFMFPCRYKAEGCTVRVLFGAIEHEDICPYRTFCCPSLPPGNCSRKVSSFDIYKHFEEVHADLISRDRKFQLTFEEGVKCNLLMVQDGVTVITQYTYDSVEGVLYFDCKDFSISNQQTVHYRLQFVSGLDADRAIVFKDIKCSHYKSHTEAEQYSTKEIMRNYWLALGSPSFIFVNVILSVTSVHQVDQRERKAQLVFSSLENVRCYRCNCFAIPPYLDSHYSHTYCYDCKSFSYYPTTEENIDISKADALEISKADALEISEADALEIPCRWRSCTFVGNQTNFRTHIQDCKYQSYKCPLPQLCQKGYYTLSNLTSHLSHMQQHGAQYCPDPENVVIELFCTDSLCKHYFTILENTVISFTCNIWDKYCWTIKSNHTDFSFSVSFEHDHCRFISKTYSHANILNLCHSKIESEFPVCFQSNKCLSAILKITQ